MVGKRRTDGTPPSDMQPTGSGAVPGNEQAAEESFGERLKHGAEGVQVSPGENEVEPALVDDPELVDDPNTDPELAEAAEEPMVKYTGDGRREITVEQWREAGVPDMPTILWERRTDFKVPKSAFTDQALQVLRQDSGFQVP